MRLAAAILALAVVATGCSLGPSSMSVAHGGRLRVVAAENFWGSIAAQLGGDRVAVTSIISKPDTDPHDYEPTAADARAAAVARYAIVNGAGYDPWAEKLLAATAVSARLDLNVGDLVGVKRGGNPHRWYSPPDVQKVIDRITADYKRLSPGNAAFFDQQRATFLSSGLARYRGLVADIRAEDGGVPVGASESVFAPMAAALGLDLLTPASFLDAVSEGAEPTAADKKTVERQITDHRIKAYVFNSQNATPAVQSQVNLAKREGIPVVPVTETLAPASATFQGWQVGQLELLQAALNG